MRDHPYIEEMETYGVGGRDGHRYDKWYDGNENDLKTLWIESLFEEPPQWLRDLACEDLKDDEELTDEALVVWMNEWVKTADPDDYPEYQDFVSRKWEERD